jgi:STAS-like domain of unknown function (DUF4325)
MKYQIRDLIGDYCVTPQSGQDVYDIVHPILLSQTEVELDFLGIKAYASPFFNYAIGQLLEDISYEDLSRLIKYTNISSVGHKVLNVVLNSAKRYYSDDKYRKAVDKVCEDELALF